MYDAPTSFSTYIVPQFINQGILPIITHNFDAAGASTSGSTVYGATSGSSAGMGTILQLWQSWYSASSPYMDKIAINIANEWGKDPSNDYIAYQGVTGTITSISGAVITINTVSATNPFAPAASVGTFLYISGSTVSSQFIQIASVSGHSGAWTITATASIGTATTGTLNGGAIAILRAIGYTCPLMIDLPYQGEDTTELTNFGASMLASDPLQNIIISAHRYAASTIVGAVTAATVSGGNATVTSALSVNGEGLQKGYYANYIGGGAQAYFSGLNGLTGINGVTNTTTYPTGGTYPLAPTVTTQGITVGGSWTGGGYTYDAYYYALMMQSLSAAATAANVLVVVGEIGPGNGVNAQYTAPQQYIQAAEHYGLGWLTWSIDDNSNGNVFDMQYNPSNSYAAPSDLSPYGQDVINNPLYGLTALASHYPYLN